MIDETMDDKTVADHFSSLDFVQVGFTSLGSISKEMKTSLRRKTERTNEWTNEIGHVNGNDDRWKHSVLISDKLLVRMPDQFQSSSTSNFLRVITGARWKA